MKQKCTFNEININSNFFQDLNCFVTITQQTKLIFKLVMKSLTSSVILTESDRINELIKAMKIMILIMTVTLS